MVSDALDAASAGFDAGYESPSQFSRDYSRVVTAGNAAFDGSRPLSPFDRNDDHRGSAAAIGATQPELSLCL